MLLLLNFYLILSVTPQSDVFHGNGKTWRYGICYTQKKKKTAAGHYVQFISNILDILDIWFCWSCNCRNRLYTCIYSTLFIWTQPYWDVLERFKRTESKEVTQAKWKLLLQGLLKKVKMLPIGAFVKIPPASHKFF